MKTKTNHKIILYTLFTIILVVGFGLGKVERASAATCSIINTDKGTSENFEGLTTDQCRQKMSEANAKDPGKYQMSINENGKNLANENSYGQQNNDKVDMCPGLRWTDIFSLRVINCLFIVIAKLINTILQAVIVLFATIIDPANITAVVGNKIIYQMWGKVRDVLNIVFILALLFSAFCTVFQIEKYSYKSMLRTIIIMALLVNFSFPLARVIIDFSNVLMYYFVQALNLNVGSGANGFFSQVANTGGLNDLVAKLSVKNDMTYLIAMDIFLAIFTATLFVIAIMFVIRLVALAFLVIFSPIAFVGPTLPFLSKYSGDWWNNLFKYSFFGPIMVFMIYVSLEMMKAISLAGGSMSNINQTMTSMAGKMGNQQGIVAALAFFAIPIVILWFGMATARKMSIAGADTVTGGAQGFLKSVGSWTAGAPLKGAWWGVKTAAKATGLSGGAKQSWNKNVTQRFDRSQKNRDAKWAGRLGDKTAGERNMKTGASQYEKDNESVSDLKQWASKGDAAAAYSLANQGKIDQKTFSESMDTIKDPRMKESLLNKAEDTRMDVTLEHKLRIDQQKAATDPTKKNWTNIQEAAETEYGKLTAEGWSKQKNLKEQFTHNAVYNPHAADIEAGAKDAFADLKAPAKVEALKRMNGGNAKAIVP